MPFKLFDRSTEAYRRSRWFRLIFYLAMLTYIIGYALFTAIPKWMDRQDWEEHPATVLHAELIEKKGPSEKHYLYVEWSYHFGDTTRIRKERVQVNDVYDTYYRLRKRLGQIDAFPCYVNPNDPSEAVLFREYLSGWTWYFILFVLLILALILSVTAYCNRARARSSPEISETNENVV